eukprot:scaffold89228_cov68-Phaeocystis_antarctica.AAC.5
MDNPDYVLQDGEFVGRSNGSNWGGLGQSLQDGRKLSGCGNDTRVDRHGGRAGSSLSKRKYVHLPSRLRACRLILPRILRYRLSAGPSWPTRKKQSATLWLKKGFDDQLNSQSEVHSPQGVSRGSQTWYDLQ